MTVPDTNPAERGTLLGAFRAALQRASATTDDMLPARVISYDRTTNRAEVLPLVHLVTTDGESLARAPVASVPVLQLGGGGFLLSFPIKSGDLAWIKASDRDLTLFLQAYREGPPNTARLHSFEDSLLIPDVMRGYSIAGEDADSVVLQTLDGAFRVALSAASVKITAGATTAEYTSGGVAVHTSAYTVQADSYQVTAPAIALVGPVAQSGGTLSAATSLTVAGIEQGGHKHGGVTRGTGFTNPVGT